MERLEAEANFDDASIEQQKRQIKAEKESVSESIIQMEDECAALEAQTSAVRKDTMEVAGRLTACVEQRDINIPEIECVHIIPEIECNVPLPAPDRAALCVRRRPPQHEDQPVPDDHKLEMGLHVG